jgi:ElaB/YqjD/DUF883 family membrane-anchored ribosome-binding protein
MEETTSSQAALADASAAIVPDLKTVIRDIQTLLKAAASSGTELAASAREQLEAALVKLQARLLEVEKAAASRATEAGKAAENYVRENPWRAIGAAAGAGLIVGLLISRR